MTTSTLNSCADPTDTFVVEIWDGEVPTALVNESEPEPVSTWQAFGGPMAAAVYLALEAMQARSKIYLAGRVDLITGIVTVHWTE